MSNFPTDGTRIKDNEISFGLNPVEGLWAEAYCNPIGGVAVAAVIDHNPNILSNEPMSDALFHFDDLLKKIVDGPKKTVEQQAAVLQEMARTVSDYRSDTYPGLRGFAIAGVFDTSIALAYAGTGAVAVARSGRRTKVFYKNKPHENFRMSVAKSPHSFTIREPGTILAVTTTDELKANHIPDNTLGALTVTRDLQGAHMFIEQPGFSG